jgi:hypothetical protein
LTEHNSIYTTNTTGAQAMTNEELLKVIEEAKASGATALNLRGEGLTTLPPVLFQLTSLKEFNLSNNEPIPKNMKGC